MIGLIVLSTIVSAAVLFSKEYKRIGAICNDGWESNSTKGGTGSSHGGVKFWKKEVVRDSIFNNIIKKIKERKG